MTSPRSEIPQWFLDMMEWNLLDCRCTAFTWKVVDGIPIVESIANRPFMEPAQ